MTIVTYTLIRKDLLSGGFIAFYPEAFPDKKKPQTPIATSVAKAIP